MRNISLVPECDILKSGHRVRPNEPGQTRNLLAPDGVPLVRHRRRPLLPSPERFLDFANLRLLESSNLKCELFERGRQNRERRQEIRVPIPLDDLRGHGCRGQSDG